MSNGIVDQVKNIMDIVCRLSTELGNPITEKDYIIEDRGCPHQSSQLPKGKCAVYMFFYKDEALKIGKANEKSNARYSSQHYGFNARSTLAKSSVADKSMWETEMNEENASDWIKGNTHRINILVDASCGDAAIELIEAVMHYAFNPRYEGALHRKGRR